MKRIVFLVTATLLIVGLVLPGCAGSGGDSGNGGNGNGNGGEDTRPPITFAIADAMTDITGENAWAGAEMARDEINTGAGVNVGGVYHKIALVQVDTNEWVGSPEEGVTALQAVIDDVYFVLGGLRAAKVQVYREVAIDAQKLFMGCGAANGVLQYSVVQNYDKYKYWFMVSPFNEAFLSHSLFKMMGTFSSMLKDKLIAEGDAVAEDYKVPTDGELRVAVLAVDEAWLAGFVAILEGKVKTSGYNFVGTWKVSLTATDISAELTAIAAKHPHIILPVFWGPVGNGYSIQKVELGIPAMTIGINIEGELKSHWTNTGGKCSGEVMLDTWAEGLQNTAKTTAFFNAFTAKTGEYPVYTAATYDAIYQLKEAIEAVSAANGWYDIAEVIAPANIDALIQYLETSSYTGTVCTTCYYPMPAINEGGGIYALSEAQVRDLYDLDSYGWTYVQSQWRCAASAMSGPHIAHDTVYGPGYAASIGSQWQDGKKVGVWPVDLGDDYVEALTDQYGCWNFEYPGTVDVVIPIEGFLAS
jgi:branched-chain amino acid transport system substrate-binding protein